MLGSRPDLVKLADTRWDLIVIGGGITGAGILHQAAQLGIKALLVEKHDFSYGTSSRSSKMVHGGLRYLKQGDIRLTRESLQEREHLLRHLPGLVVRQSYLFPLRRGQFPGRWAMTVALWFYDLLAGVRDHRWVSADDLAQRVPALDTRALTGAMRYTDALTDDSRLVMRILHDAVEEGGRAINYCGVNDVSRRSNGDLTLSVTDHAAKADPVRGGTPVTATLVARRVINATGAWADQLSGTPARVRPQRGSHLFVPAQRLPLSECLTLVNPRDGRPVFVFPWEGETCIGTTDLDHRDDPDREPRATRKEIDYLLELVNGFFPDVQLTDADILSTMAGVRPIIASGKGGDPSSERRDHAVWSHDGVITVSGGKLTTFRVIALDALAVAGFIDRHRHRALRRAGPRFAQNSAIPTGLGHPLRRWPEGDALLAEIDWVLQHEMVQHLDDLMLRRTRLGNMLPRGGEERLPVLAKLVCERLGWDQSRWEVEVQRYLDIIQDSYSVQEA
ncbi:glycerol-3-phosphate dehydrogenase/oxidase [Alcanivorax sp. JB21]|uniref:glycerol-3-phosphate dehydrogenase/oxidase n=1 Tax=Alcanivorax limicola TaxID=2874102 RepID=UPI001CBF83BE|nr:glycerol-3-phosphate dehydrogenase/oxidase [Alcanivorax limicola]MBZ2187912.1 glycerol-3-phosphate dehydrogenase/oxidase [Alcanivorax limicola]